MVKGTSRRVIVIKSPDPHIFDEAIFIVKEDIFHRGITNEDILKEAQLTADKYIKSQGRLGLFSRLPPSVFAFLGAAATAAVWILSQYVF